jgi:transcriptional regulator with XRE-family HTH domain
MTTLADRIREARQSAGLSQRAVGASCNPPISGQAVYKWEKGKAIPSAEDLDILAQLTGRSVKWFLYGIENIPNGGSLVDASGVGRDVPSVDFNQVFRLLEGDDRVKRQTVRTNFPSSDRAFQTYIGDDANDPVVLEGDSVIIDHGRPPRPGLYIAAAVFGFIGVGWLWSDYIAPILGLGRRDF